MLSTNMDANFNSKMKFTAESPGYKGHVFPNKQEQMAEVVTFVEAQGFIPKELVKNEVSWFYGF